MSYIGLSDQQLHYGIQKICGKPKRFVGDPGDQGDMEYQGCPVSARGQSPQGP